MRIEVTSVKEIPDMHSMGHTCANLNGDLLFVWGGTNDQVAYVAIKNSSIWIYETLTGYWRHRTCSGECPPYLSSAASCLIGQKMYIFGGHSTVQDNWMNGLYCLDLETFIWTDAGAQAQAEPTKPIRSDKNVAWSFGGKLYVFGGYGWSQVEHYSELLDCQRDLQLAPDQRWPKFGWNNQLVEYNPGERQWRWPHYTGKCPSARAAHSGALMGHLYYVFGGRDCNERLNDLYTFNMHTFEWQQVAVVTSGGSHLFRPLQEQPRQLPIGHLLDQDEVQVDENHRQLVEEMHQVHVDEDEDFASLPSSSSSSGATNQQQDNISADHLIDCSGKPAVSGQSNEEDDYEDDFEFPRPSHMLERWSLSSSGGGGGGDQQANGGANCLPQLLSDSQNPLLFNTPTQNNNQDIDQQQQQQELSTVNESAASHSSVAAPESGANQDHEATNAAAIESPSSSSSSSSSLATAVAPAPAPPQLPTGRSFCSLTPISDEQMALFGGVNSQDQNLDDCWIFNVTSLRWTKIDYKHKLTRPRLWHTGSRTKANEVVIMGGSCSEKIDEYCSDVLVISFEPKSLKKLALDAVSRSVRMKTIQRTRGLPSTLIKLIKLRKQAMALTTHRPILNQQQQQGR